MESDTEIAILQDFEKPTPRKVCFKQNSRKGGVGFNPWDIFSTIGGCGGTIVGVLLLVALIPALRSDALRAAVFFAVPVGLFSLLSLAGVLPSLRHHRRLAQYGEAVMGRVTRLEFVAKEDGTPAVCTHETLEYEFHTRSGLEVSGKRASISGWYKALPREGHTPDLVLGIPVAVESRPVVVVYLPNNPKVNEPYNSLRYRVCD